MMTSNALKVIGNLRSQNTYNASSRKVYEKGGTNKTVRDEEDDAIA